MRYGRTPRRKGDEVDNENVPSWEETSKLTHYEVANIANARLRSFIESVTDAHMTCCNYMSTNLKDLEPRVAHHVCFYFFVKFVLATIVKVSIFLVISYIILLSS